MEKAGRPLSFKTRELRSQADFFERNFGGKAGFCGHACRLMPEHARLNVSALIREAANVCFSAEPVIQWHQHANHGLSSQVCCVNFLMPMADQLDVLARWVGHVLGIEPPEMLPIEMGRAGRNWYVAFEWIGEVDYLNEGDGNGRRKRGANATAADAAVMFRAGGKTHLLLIEWKYTESYGGHRLSEDRRGTRLSRYGDIAFQPQGPIRADLGLTLADFFHEPFYQLLRQQMLAWHIEQDAASGIDRARVLHISPGGNRTLHKVTSPALERLGDDAFDVFRSVLSDPSAFISRATEEAFAPLAEWPDAADWYGWLRERYPSLCRATSAIAA
jgi:hypothetical protein